MSLKFFLQQILCICLTKPSCDAFSPESLFVAFLIFCSICAYLTFVNNLSILGENPRFYSRCLTWWMLKYREMRSTESNQQTNISTCVHSWEIIYSSAEGSHCHQAHVQWPSATPGLGRAQVEGQGAWWPQHDPHPTILTATSHGARAKHVNPGCDE